MGIEDGRREGATLGENVGNAVLGVADGNSDGLILGVVDGSHDGATVGVREGFILGEMEGMGLFEG